MSLGTEATAVVAAGPTRTDVTGSAMAFWALGNGGTGSSFALTPTGTISLNQPAKGIGATPGGNTATVSNAYWSAGNGAGISGSALTVYLRARDTAGLWNSGLLAKRGNLTLLNYNLFSVDLAGTAGTDIGFEVRLSTGVKQVSFPISKIGAIAWHDIVGRYDGVNLELFCDGRLMARTPASGTILGSNNNEPTLIGAETDNGSVVRRFTGEMEEAGIWSYALSAAEIASLVRRPGGLAELPANLIHYRIPTFPLGDMHPHFIDNRWFVTYLYEPPYYRSGIAESANLLDWTQTLPTHTAPSPVQQLPPYYLLCMVRDPVAQNWRTFYGYNGMRASTSTDLYNWTFANPQNPLQPHPGQYDRESDPYVFWNPDANLWWMVMTLRRSGEPANTAGAVGHASSPDLVNWTWLGELYYPGNVGDPECPMMWKQGSKWYLLASYSSNGVGRPSYRIADSASGPWTTPVPDSLDGRDLCAAMSAPGANGNQVLFGWIPDSPRPPQSSQSWGGHLGLPRELYPLADGTLGSKIETTLGLALRGSKQYPPAEGTAASVKNGSWTIQNGGSDFRYIGPGTAGVVALAGGYDRFEISANLTFGGGTQSSAFLLNYSDASGAALPYQVIIDKVNKKLSIGLQGASGTNSELVLPVMSNGPHSVRIVVEEDMVELFFDDTYSLAARIAGKLLTTSVALSATSGGFVDFNNVEIYNLRAPAYVAQGGNSEVAGWEVFE